MEKAIRCAIEGGYEIGSDRQTPEERLAQATIEWEYHLYRPLFWESLGKALGWYEITGKLPTDVTVGEWKENTWLAHWHSFIDWLAAGKSATDFFKELLAQK